MNGMRKEIYCTIIYRILTAIFMTKLVDDLCALSAGGGDGSQCTKHGRELPHVRGQGQQPTLPGCDGTGTAERSYPMSEARGDGWEEIPHVRGQGWRPGGATLCPRSRATAERSNCTPKEWWLCRHRRA